MTDVKVRKVSINNILKGLKINKRAHTIVLHCSASDNPAYDAFAIQNDHKSRFNDIGYHFFIDFVGDVFVCRPMTSAPAAQKGYNTNTIAICVGGLSKFTDAQFYTLELLTQQLQEKYNGFVVSKRLKVLGHKNIAVNPKDCPVFDYAEELNLLYEGEEIITARWSERDKNRNKIKKSKNFTVPKYYIRPKQVLETRTGKGIATATTATAVSAAKIATATVTKVATTAAIAGGVVDASKNIDLEKVAETVDLLTTISMGVSKILDYVPLWLCFVVVIMGLALAWYARQDDIQKGDVKRIFKVWY